jgi:catechol 2,3-dioxygenase-like lactoylglutathione lyase family enzyme
MSDSADSDTAAYELASLHHVQLAIPEGGEDVARRFYGEILGMTELEKPPELAAGVAAGSVVAGSRCTSASRRTSGPWPRRTPASSSTTSTVWPNGSRPAAPTSTGATTSLATAASTPMICTATVSNC